MKNSIAAAAGLCVLSGAALAGGIDRSGQGIGIIFEKGDYAEIGLSYGNPDVSGTAPPGYGGQGSGNMAGDYTLFGAAFKHQFNDRFSLALIFDQPWRADVAYPTGTGYPFAGSTATLRSNTLTAIARYKVNDNVSVHGGLRYETLKGEINLPVYGYAMKADQNEKLGWLVGAAYEVPDIALRVAVTYNSKIEHELTTHEGPSPSVLPVAGKMTSSMPESVNLDMQTGVAKDTLVFGQIRWVNWPQFDVSPPNFPANPLVSYDSATWSYTLGVGRKFNDQWAGSVAIGYEPSTGDNMTNLNPVDGYVSLGVGASYTRDNMKISAGVRYAWLAKAHTRTIGATFDNNTALGVGVKVGWSF